MNSNAVKELSELFRTHTGSAPDEIAPLPKAGSDREYYRLSKGEVSIMGAFNPDVRENDAFFYITRHFSALSMPVSELIAVSEHGNCYLVTDLGDTTLFSVIEKTDWKSAGSAHTLELLKRTLSLLAKLQVEGTKGFDFDKCYPKATQDVQATMWDLNYFKYCFLKPSGIPFDEELIERDFLILAKAMSSEPNNFFLYRDFQSRNVMLVNNEPYFIDYQGGREGSGLYDVASFLYQARASIPQAHRDELLEYYLNELTQLADVDADSLREQFPVFVLGRTLQVLGAYGYRGLFERRSHFLKSIPYAASNLKEILPKIKLKIPVLTAALNDIQQEFGAASEQKCTHAGLTVIVTSFSYRKGYPIDNTEHGGGFVFDCRSLPNPGRQPEYKHLTGMDAPVANFLKGNEAVQRFAERTQSIAIEAAEGYKNRGFGYLSVAFGCTGGQHRSVFLTNALADKLKGVPDLKVVVVHRELQ